jgi:transposase
LEAERGFRDLKTVLELRPVLHRLEHRIRAHVLLCWLALLLIRVAERRARQIWNRIAPNSAASTRSPSPARTES